MATTFYLRFGEDQWGDSGVPRWNAKDAGRAITPGATALSALQAEGRLITTVGAGTGNTSARTVGTVAGATAGVVMPGSALRVDAFGWFSAPLAADVTVSGTISFNICGLESSMSANAGFQVAVYRVDSQGAMTLIVNSEHGTELGTANARMSWTATPTSTALFKGDRIAVMVLINDVGTMGAGFTVTHTWDGSTANTADSNIVFTETITLDTAFPSGTSYYLRDTASPISGAKALSATQGSGTATAVRTTTNGPLTFPGGQWTATAGGSAIEWFTPPLDAFTLGGVVAAALGIPSTAQADNFESDVTPFDSMVAEVAICDADGSNPVVWARSYTQNPVLPSSSPKFTMLSGPSTAVGQGKVLRFRMYSGDYRPSNQVAGTNRTIRYDGVTTYASRLIFSQTITEAAPAAFIAAKPMVITQAVARASNW